MNDSNTSIFFTMIQKFSSPSISLMYENIGPSLEFLVDFFRLSHLGKIMGAKSFPWKDFRNCEISQILLEYRSSLFATLWAVFES